MKAVWNGIAVLSMLCLPAAMHAQDWEKVNLDRLPEFIQLEVLSGSTFVALTPFSNQLYRTEDGADTWQSVIVGTGELLRLYFLDAQRGWVVGENGQIHATADGGVTWSPQSSCAAGQSLRSTYFLDAQHGWVVGDGGAACQTSDGGGDWIAFGPDFHGHDLYDVFFLDLQHGWVVGQMELQRTTDGTTWYGGVDGPDSPTYRIRFFDPTDGLASQKWIELYDPCDVYTDTIWRSQDGGANWLSQHAFPTSEIVLGLELTGADTAECLSRDGVLYSTSNRGGSWQQTALWTGLLARAADLSGDDGAYSVGTGSLFVTHDRGTSWAPLGTGTSGTLSDMAWLDSQTGLYVDEGRSMYLSEDAGRHWSTVFEGDFSCGPMEGSRMADRVEVLPNGAVVAVGVLWNGYMDPDLACFVGDGHSSWDDYSIEPRTMDSFKALFFLDSQRGWAATATQLWTTPDGGQTWTGLSTGGRSIQAIHFIDAQRGWIACRNGIIASTGDGGSSWTNRIALGDLDFYDVHVDAGSLEAWAVGWRSSNVRIYHSSGGVNWSEQTNKPGGTGRLYAVDFIDDQEGWAVGDGGWIIHTVDGGSSWSQQQSTVSSNLRSLFVFDTTLAYVGGAAGTVLRYVGRCGDGSVDGGEDCDPGAGHHCCDPITCTWTPSGQADPQDACSGAAECELDVCNGAGGCQVIDADDGTACTADSDPCTDDVCASGLCDHPAAELVCGDGEVCGVEDCDPGAGHHCCDPITCTWTLSGESDPQGSCATATECQRDVCDGGGGCAVEDLDDGAACSDEGDPCTDDVCSSGQCIHPAAALVCGDGALCGSEDCDPGLPRGDHCCDPDTCAYSSNGSEDPQGVCAGAVECQVELCDGQGGCVSQDADDGTPCSQDPLFCNGREVCLGGDCSSPGNPCPNPDDCDEDLDICSGCGDGSVNGGEECDPGSPRNDHCCDPATCLYAPHGGPDPQGVCAGAPECQVDVCDGSGGCATEDVDDGTACSPDDDPCTEDLCSGGQCTHPTAEIVCGDGALCGLESCETAAPYEDHCCDPLSCTWTPDGGLDPQGECAGALECQVDLCDGSGGCRIETAEDGTPCTDDGLFCTGEERCEDGACESDGNPCDGICDEERDECLNDERPPVIAETANLRALVGVAYIYDRDGRADAAGASPIEWSVLEGPEGFHIDRSSGVVGWTPQAAGDVEIQLLAENDFGSDDYDFTVSVTEESVQPPTAVIATNPYPPEGFVPFQIQFNGAQSTSPSSEIVSHKWIFGDGSPVEYDQVVNHDYLVPGGYKARLIVFDANGLKGEASVGILVSVRTEEGEIAPPSASIVASEREGEGTLTVQFACDCRAGSAPIAAYQWDFGDGSQSVLEEVSHSFSVGAYRVRLTVMDDNGLYAHDWTEVVVTEGGLKPPVVDAGVEPVSGEAPLEVWFIGLAADSDGEIVSRGWQFGDGGEASEESARHIYAQPGIYQATFHAEDDSGLEGFASVEILVSDENRLLPPSIISAAGLEARVGEAYRYDTDGLPAARGSRPFEWSIGRQVGGETVGKPEGMQIEPGTGRITWTPTEDQKGEQRVSLVVRNGAGADAQEFVVQVESDGSGGGGCGCASGRADRSADIAMLLLLALVLSRRRLGIP
ncbi:MAG: PKD domain-containing protein [Deltaproteobacteria bacterium]|nr:PKD domain-containing protein [Deltaproteobacteria bacterium]